MTSTGSDLGWLPELPAFRRLDLEADKARYNRFYAQFPPYADFSFGSLAIWLDAVDDLEAARVDGNLVLRFTDVYRDGNTALCVLGDNATGATMVKLFEHLSGLGVTPRLIEVPEPCLAKLDSASVEVVADRDSFEYLLGAEQHAELRGGGHLAARDHPLPSGCAFSLRIDGREKADMAPWPPRPPHAPPGGVVQIGKIRNGPFLILPICDMPPGRRSRRGRRSRGSRRAHHSWLTGA